MVGTDNVSVLNYLKYSVIQKMDTDSLFAQIGDSNDKYSSLLEVEC
jgi:hypothetical protein